MSAPQAASDRPAPPVDIQQALHLALARHQAGAAEEAERLYRQVLEADPAHPRALLLYGLLTYQMGRPAAAEPLLRQAAEAQPESLEPHLVLGDVYMSVGRQDEAIAAYRRVLALQPGHPQALLNLSGLLIDRGFAGAADFEGGIDVCRAAIALLPDPAPAHAVLGRILLTSGRAREAAEAFRTATTLAPATAAPYAGLALALLEAGDVQGGLAAADQALARAPALAEGLFARGRALLLLNQPQAALVTLERGVALAPQEARMHLALGDACAELDLYQRAVDHLAHAARLDPRSKWAHANLGSMLYRAGQLEAAELSCRRALELDDTLVVVHKNLAGILADRSQAEAARRHRDTAYRLENLHVERAPDPAATVLVLTTADSGNIPHRFLLPKDRYSRIDWFIEYARPNQAAELPPYDVVFNIIGDPDYAGPTEAPVAAFLQQCERPVLNDPARVGPTRRDRLPGLLAGIEGLALPKAARLDPAQAEGCDVATWAAARGLAGPLLIRPIGSHGGRGLTLARTPEELAVIDPTGGLYATEFVDYASPADGLYRKYRVIFVDRTPYPYHLAIKQGWLVHYWTAEMSGDAARQAEELSYLRDPAAALGEAAWTAVTEIGRRLDLDYAGADFSVLPDGRVLVFEANPTMLVHPERDAEFAYKNAFVGRITTAFQARVAACATQGRGGA